VCSPQIATTKINYYQCQESKFEGGLPQARTARMFLIRSDRVGWQSAVSLRAVWQEFITVVADPSMEALDLGIE
jgi:hypothetical protein